MAATDGQRATPPQTDPSKARLYDAFALLWGAVFRRPYTGSVAAKGERLIVDNRRARHDYHLLDRVEAGLVLTGTEVKSLREGRASLQQAYADIRDGEAWLVGAHISVYEQGNIANHDPDRDRKLLLHKKELSSLAGKVAQRGLTLVPTKLYFKDGRAKVELALARGKEQRDKRRDIAKREADRQMERALKSRR
jgi:SsrA-binding protein